MDQIHSFVGDPVPTVPEHNLVTHLESLRWWVLHLNLQQFDRFSQWGQHGFALGSGIMGDVD